MQGLQGPKQRLDSPSLHESCPGRGADVEAQAHPPPAASSWGCPGIPQPPGRKHSHVLPPLQRTQGVSPTATFQPALRSCCATSPISAMGCVCVHACEPVCTCVNAFQSAALCALLLSQYLHVIDTTEFSLLPCHPPTQMSLSRNSRVPGMETAFNSNIWVLGRPGTRTWLPHSLLGDMGSSFCI